MAAGSSERDEGERITSRDGALPGGFLVGVDATTRIHFLDWGAPVMAPESSGAEPAAVVLLHGVAGTSWVWAPVARRLAATRRVVSVDLRGHGLSDAPTDGYSLAGLAADARAVIEAAGLAAVEPGPVLAGHGFGAMVAADLAGDLGDRCAGLVLVDGGWEDLTAGTGLEPEELLRSLDEPPEVLASMAAYLADRQSFDPASWDADQERAARAAVVELPAGRLIPLTRPHVLAACVESMLSYRPADVLAAVRAPVSVVVAGEPEAADALTDEDGLGPAGRLRALAGLTDALIAAGLPRPGVVNLVGVGHNVMRYRPAEVAAAIDGVDRARGAYHPGP